MKQHYSLPLVLMLCISLSITVTPIRAETGMNSNAQGNATSQISGLVTDDEDYPLTYVLIYAYQAEANNGVWKEVNYTMTDATGAYTICCLPAGIYRVDFTSQSHYPEFYDNAASVDKATDISVASGVTVTNINAQLAHKGRIRGRLTDKQGGPLKGISVTAYTDLDGAWSEIGFATTDSHGDYRIEGLDSGTYRIGFQDYSGRMTNLFYKNATTVEKATNIKVGQDGTVNGIDAQLAGPTGRIQGMVTNENNQPLFEADIMLYQDADLNGVWEGLASDTTDANGVYVVSGLPDGVYRVQLSDIIYQPKTCPFQRYATQYYNAVGTLDAATNVVIQGGNTVTNINAHLALAGRIRGRVTDVNNNPVARISVEALTSKTGEGPCFASSTDANGAYEIGIAAGTYRIFFDTYGAMGHYLSYTAEFYDNVASFDAATSLQVSERGVVAGIDAQLGPPGTIRGLVSDLNGVGLSQIKVTAYSAASGNGLWIPFSTTETDAAGAYALPGVGGNDYNAVAYRVSFEDLRTPPQYHAKVYLDAGYPETGQDVLVPTHQEVGGINIQLAPFDSINLAPLAHDDPMLLFPDAGTNRWLSDGSVLANDRDAEAEPLHAALVGAPSQGDLTLDASGVFTYTPTASAWISDTFTYRTQDQSHESNLATVTFFPGVTRLFLPVIMR